MLRFLHVNALRVRIQPKRVEETDHAVALDERLVGKLARLNLDTEVSFVAIGVGIGGMVLRW